MLSVAILAASALVVLQAFSLALKLQAHSADLLTAGGIAEEKFQELSFMENRGTLTGKLGGAAGDRDRFSWEYTFAPDKELKLERMELSLRWTGRNRDERFNLSAYFTDDKK